MSILDGMDYDFGNNDYNMSNWWSNNMGNTDTSDWLNNLSSPEYGLGDGGSGDTGGGLLGGAASGAAAGSAFGPWGALIGAGIGALGSFFGSKSQSAQEKEKEKLQEKLYAFQLAEQEKYYQQHGQQLSAALGNYAQFQKPANAPSAMHDIGNAPSPMGANQQFIPQQPLQQSGLLTYGY